MGGEHIRRKACFRSVKLIVSELSIRSALLSLMSEEK